MLRRHQVRETIKAGNILIKEGSILPEVLRIQSEPCVPGWKLVGNFDGYGLDRELRETGWTFFCLASDVRATVLGMDGYALVCRAVKKILNNPKSYAFNALEITRVVSKSFLGVAYVSLSARSRHIQESLFLFQRPTEAKRDSLTRREELAPGKILPSERAPKQNSAEDLRSVIA